MSYRTIADAANALLAGEKIILELIESPQGDDWSTTLERYDDAYWVVERSCTTDTCNCVSHDPWRDRQVTPTEAYGLLADVVRRAWLAAEPLLDPVVAAALGADPE